VEFRVLGPVEIQTDDGVLDVGPPQLRHVLAALAVDAGRPVTTEALIQRVWDDRAPDGARRTVHVHIVRIRQLLDRASRSGQPPASLVRGSGGYRLDVDPDLVDLHRFRGLVNEASTPDRSDAERVALLGEALSRWRGEPLSGVTGQWAERVRVALRQQHLDAVVAWAEAEIRLGRPETAVGSLAELADVHPLAERPTAALMRALQAAGRAGEALDRYGAIRRRLADELGIDPSGDLQRLHQAILRGELDPVSVRVEPPSLSPPPAPVRRVPAQLPADVYGFAGRADELAELDRVLARAADQPTAVAVAGVWGPAGVGKTALAVHWAHRVRDRFPDGQLYVDLRGFDPAGASMAPSEAVRQFLDALDVPPQRVPVDVRARAALYRTVLAGRRILVVLDNARDADQIRPLLPGTPGCVVLVTSRTQLTGLVAVEGAHPVPLGLPTEREARDLLTRRLGQDRTDAEPDAVAEIIVRCARLPLALAITAARAATNPGLSLAILAKDLDDARDRLDALATGDPTSDVRTVFSWSCRALTADAARLFRLLGLHPGPDIAVPAAASLAGVSARAVRPLLDELARAHLATEYVHGRFVLHDLLRAYAAEQVQAVESDEQRDRATHRIIGYYLHSAYAAAMAMDPHREAIDIAPCPPGVVPEHAADSEQALRWFNAEHDVLMAAVGQAARTGWERHAWQLARVCVTFLDQAGHWSDWVDVQTVALGAARRLGDRPRQAFSHRSLGLVHALLGHYDDAGTHLRYAADLYDDLDDRVGQARTHLNLASMYAPQGQVGDALRHSQQALDLLGPDSDREARVIALTNIGWYHAMLGEHEQAVVRCEQALDLSREIGDRHSEACVWDSLGYAHHHLGHHEYAIDCYRNALDLYRQESDRYHEADTLVHLGDTHQATGDSGAARDAYETALVILDQLDHPDSAGVRAKLHQLDRSGG
jgi:DNA-binding SARP family transcriptional activator